MQVTQLLGKMPISVISHTVWAIVILLNIDISIRGRIKDQEILNSEFPLISEKDEDTRKHKCIESRSGDPDDCGLEESTKRKSLGGVVYYSVSCRDLSKQEEMQGH